MKVPTSPTRPQSSASVATSRVELSGIERLEGTYPFTLARSVSAFRINDYLHRMVEPSHREAFLRDPEASFESAGLTEEERDLIRRRDWRGLIHYGVIFFMLEKLGAVTGVSNLHIYAAMRGETLEAFQRTRNAPGRAVFGGGQRSRPSQLGSASRHGKQELIGAGATPRSRSPPSACNPEALEQE